MSGSTSYKRFRCSSCFKKGKANGYREQPQPVRNDIQRHMYPCKLVKGAVQRRKAHGGPFRPYGPHVHIADRRRPQYKSSQCTQRLKKSCLFHMTIHVSFLLHVWQISPTVCQQGEKKKRNLSSRQGYETYQERFSSKSILISRKTRVRAPASASHS